MWVPLVVLAIFTVLSATLPATSFRGLVADAAQSDPASAIGDKVSALVPAVSGDVLHDAHTALGGIVGFAFVVGMGLGWAVYRNGLATGEAVLRRVPFAAGLHRALANRLYIDDAYDVLLVGGTRLIATICGFFDRLVVNGVAQTTYSLSGTARRAQTGRIRLYILTTAGIAGLVILLIAFWDQILEYSTGSSAQNPTPMVQR
jgi:NADH:ubiquinone oxidoreductase subunit 5 (subunit L)/multisubunit Na+/H+ antiporter MnhA subunit